MSGRKIYTVEKGTSDPKFAWQLCCNNRHIQWFSDETIAREVCDKLNARELIKEAEDAD